MITVETLPMEAQTAAALPEGPGWQYEPKWDGFRCLVFRDGETVELRSKSGTPLGRYFPDVVTGLLALPPARFVLDGELLVPIGDATSFEALQMRLHPAASRVAKLAAANPARFMAFDLLLDASGAAFDEQPLAERRAALEAFVAGLPGDAVQLSPAVHDVADARRWLEQLPPGQDGVIAKRPPWSGRSCSACTTRKAGSTTSATPRPSRPRSGRR